MTLAHSRSTRVGEDDGGNSSHATEEGTFGVKSGNLLVPRSDLRSSRRSVLNTHGNGDDQNGRHDRDEADPAQDGDLVQCLDRSQSECSDHSNNNPSDSTRCVYRDGIECDRDGDES